MLKVLCTIYFWSVATIGVILTAIASGLAYPFVEQKTFARIYESVAGYFIFYAMSIPGIWSLKITDLRQHKTFDDRYVMIANHASFCDSLMVSLLPINKKFMMAKIFTKIPIFGWLCRTSGHVLVDRHDSTSTRPAVNKAVKTLYDGSSFMIYPEGRRSSDPTKLLPFKTGAFRLAQRVGLPILPMILRGTGQAMPIGGFCQPCAIEIIICDPIQVGPTWKDLDDAKKKCHAIIESHLT